MIKELNDVLEVTPGDARKLLQYAKWQKDRVLERYYDGDRVRLYEEAGVAGEKAKENFAEIPADTCCDICCCEFEQTNAFVPDCGCLYCRSCWNEYLIGRIMD